MEKTNGTISEEKTVYSQGKYIGGNSGRGHVLYLASSYPVQFPARTDCIPVLSSFYGGHIVWIALYRGNNPL